MDAARGPGTSVVVLPAPRHRVGARGGGRYTHRRRIRLVAYGARLEIVLGVKALAGSNPASSASYQAKRRHPGTRVAGVRRLVGGVRLRPATADPGQVPAPALRLAALGVRPPLPGFLVMPAVVAARPTSRPAVLVPGCAARQWIRGPRRWLRARPGPAERS